MRKPGFPGGDALGQLYSGRCDYGPEPEWCQDLLRLGMSRVADAASTGARARSLQRHARDRAARGVQVARRRDHPAVAQEVADCHDALERRDGLPPP